MTVPLQPLLAAVLLVGCGGAGGKNAKDVDVVDDPVTTITPSGCDADQCGEVAPRARFARLTHLQWENTVVDLLHLDAPTGLSSTFIGDGLSDGYDNNAESLVVSSELWQDYQRAAEDLAGRVMADPALYATVVPQDPRTAGGGIDFEDRIEAEAPGVVTTTGASGGDYWNLWSTGDLEASFDLPDTSTYTVTARVWADQAGPDLAQMALGVDGADLLVTDVTAVSEGAAELIEVEIELPAGVHTVHVSFLNDFYDPYTGADRNLKIDWVEVTSEGSSMGASTAGVAERDAWLADFGRRAFRRPLTDAELADYAGLFDAGPELLGSGDDFADGVQVALTAMLQAPFFLYRHEESTAAHADGHIALSDYELASKLSYALWNTMPDDALLDRAEAGALSDPDGLRAEAERLLDDARSVGAIDDFHSQMLHVDGYDNIFKDPGQFPEYDPAMNDWMKTEALLFTREIVEGGHGIHELYSAPWTFANAGLAPVYGVDVAGDAFVRTDLDPSQRAGLLTLSGFLAAEADAYQPNSIHRGVFVDLSVLCIDLPAPPDNIVPLPPPDGAVTNRERIDGHTGAGTCGEGCHATLINPPGFAFENYDALGRYRTEDAGQPVDATGSFRFSDGEQTWTDAVGFASILADNRETHRCYVRNWLEFLHGRAIDPADDGLLDFLADKSRLEDRPVRDLVLDVVTSDGFRHRTDGEL